MWPVLPLVQSSCWILWSSISLEWIKWYHSFLPRVIHRAKVESGTTTFGWVRPVVTRPIKYQVILVLIKRKWHLRLPPLGFRANQIPRFFDHQYLWKESIDTFVWPLSVFFIYLYPRIFLSNIAGVHFFMTCLSHGEGIWKHVDLLFLPFIIFTRTWRRIY